MFLEVPRVDFGYLYNIYTQVFKNPKYVEQFGVKLELFLNQILKAIQFLKSQK